MLSGRWTKRVYSVFIIVSPFDVLVIFSLPITLVRMMPLTSRPKLSLRRISGGCRWHCSCILISAGSTNIERRCRTMAGTAIGYHLPLQRLQ